MLSERQSEAIASLCLMAAFADGERSDVERARLKDIFDSLEGSNHATVYQRVLLKQATLAGEVASLETREARTLAYELAVGVCDADGVTNAAERAFLTELAAALGIDSATAERVLEDADALADAPLETPLAAVVMETASRPGSAVAERTAASRPEPESAGARAADPARDKAVDELIDRTAMLCGGLELLPQNLATLGILPLQTKLVHDIGALYGHTLDRGHIGEFLATIGAGVTSQVIEGYARKFLGKLARRSMGRMAGSLAGVATGAAISFASTWAIGHVARQYYAGGRSLAAVDLQRLYQEKLAEGRRTYAERSGSAGAGPGMVNAPGFIDLDGLIGMLRRK